MARLGRPLPPLSLMPPQAVLRGQSGSAVTPVGGGEHLDRAEGSASCRAPQGLGGGGRGGARLLGGSLVPASPGLCWLVGAGRWGLWWCDELPGPVVQRFLWPETQPAGVGDGGRAQGSMALGPLLPSRKYLERLGSQP